MASEVTALDEARFGLRVYAVAPGVIDTEMQVRHCWDDRSAHTGGGGQDAVRLRVPDEFPA